MLDVCLVYRGYVLSALRIVVFFFLCLLCTSSKTSAVDLSSSSCSYTTYKWNVNLKQAVSRKRVTHPYENMQPFEIDSQTGCTVCEEDQVVIDLKTDPTI